MKPQFVLVLSSLTLLTGCNNFIQSNPIINLFLAVQADDTEGVKAALNQGANVNATALSVPGLREKLGEEDSTPLLLAVKYGRSELVELLLKNGANPNVSLEYQRRPLEEALVSNNANITRMLLGAKANPNANFVLLQARRPLEREMLIKAGANPNYIAPGPAGYCLMNYAGPEPKAHPLWQFLKRHGGKPRHITQGDKTPVYFWTLRGQPARAGWKTYGEVRSGLAK